MNSILFYGTYLTSFIPLLVFVIFFKRNNNQPVRVIALYQFYSILNDILITFVKNKQNSNSLHVESILSSLFTTVEFLFFSAFFLLIIKNKSNRKAIYFGISIFLIVSLIDFFFLFKGTQNQNIFSTIPISISAITLIIFSILYLFEQIQNPEVSFIYSKSNFWIVVGIMLYFAGTFFLFLQFSELSSQEQYSYWIINWVCIILKNILFSIAFYLPKENPYHIENEIKTEFSLFKELD
ncbi:hypothetical protein [Flavihumibacter sp. ZG627]|uniref:hypothetical protein n=1 Tax=Flavihumibacter sp. ZG627 TaxID=1463156 RepID=UPI00057DA0E5|nr:hypothetical protein [Flavihumibacter sp. ZG627]KIC89383.1 hypothetical protein HY58_17380 [Flavihumibacter sp. ZG627]